tara:strand:- start:864 stop:1640 length:777 start_codon:yes stop_codon:yes gene_type:complete
MSIEELYSKRRQIRAAWDPHKMPSKELIYDLLKRTQNISPSKQNLYPFKIHAFGIDDLEEKRIVEQICCLFPTGSVNEFDRSKEEHISQGTNNNMPGWVLVFELRKAKKNKFIKDYERRYEENKPSVRYTQIDEHRFRENSNRTLAAIEVGMFTKILAGLCLENDLAISYIKSFPEWSWKGSRGEYKKNKNKVGLSWDSLPQITEAPLLVVQIGYKANIEDPLATTVEIDGVVIASHDKQGIMIEDKPNINDIVRFNK